MRFFVTLLGVLFLLTSCNIYAPFSRTASNEDFIEEATKCLNDGDFDCAIENYNKLPDGQLRRQKLCTGYLSKAGFTLNSFLNVVTQGQASMLGSLSNSLLPYTATKESDVALGKAACDAFDTNKSETESNTAALLVVMGAFVDCAVRMSKTDTLVATSEDFSGTCNSTTAGNGDGSITTADIGASDGVLSASNPGMCYADVEICAQAIFNLTSDDTSSSLGNAGLGDIQDAFNNLPDDVKQDFANQAGDAAKTAAAQTARTGLRGTLSN